MERTNGPKGNLVFEIPAEEYDRRLRQVQEALTQRQLDLGIGYATSFMPGAMQYLTGFDPHIEPAALVVGPAGVYVLGGPEIEAMARPVIRCGHIRTVVEFQILPQHYAHARYRRLRDVLEEASAQRPVRRVGILVRGEFLPIHWLDMLRSVMGGDVEFLDAGDILAEMRFLKSQAEVSAFRRASQIATQAIHAMLQRVRPGVRELEVAAIGDRAAKEAGAYNFGFDTIVMSGPRINTIVGRATNRVIREGELVSLAVSPRFEGYTSTLGRTVVAGRASPEQIVFLDHGRHAMEIAVTCLQPGRAAGALEEAVAAYFKQVGLHEYVSYSVLHGIGLSEVLDEKVPRGDQLIVAGVTLMLDVGLFFHPQFHGLRHEDPFVVHPDGEVERMTDLPIDVYRQ